MVLSWEQFKHISCLMLWTPGSPCWAHQATSRWGQGCSWLLPAKVPCPPAWAWTRRLWQSIRSWDLRRQAFAWALHQGPPLAPPWLPGCFWGDETGSENTIHLVVLHVVEQLGEEERGNVSLQGPRTIGGEEGKSFYRAGKEKVMHRIFCSFYRRYVLCKRIFFVIFFLKLLLSILSFSLFFDKSKGLLLRIDNSWLVH